MTSPTNNAITNATSALPPQAGNTRARTFQIKVTIVAATGNIYSGLWYPVGIAVMSLIIGFLFLPETKDVDIRRT